MLDLPYQYRQIYWKKSKCLKNMRNFVARLTETQMKYLDMLTAYEKARSEGVVGKYFVNNVLALHYKKEPSTIQKDLQRARKIKRSMKDQMNENKKGAT